MQLNEFIDLVEVKRETHPRSRVKEVVRVVLAALGERLYRTPRKALAAQLPGELEKMLEAEVDGEAERMDTPQYPLEEYYQRVAARADLSYDEAVSWSRDVVSVLEKAVTSPVIEEAAGALPDSYRELFGQPPESPASPRVS